MPITHTWTIATCKHDVATGGKKAFVDMLTASLVTEE